MFAFQKLRVLGNHLRSLICPALALPAMLLIATAPRLAVAQDPYRHADQFAYVADEDSGKVSGYVVNNATGKLTPIEGSPFTTGKSGPTSVAVDPAGRFLYATNQYSGNNDVAGFVIDCGTGKLTPISGSPFKAGSGPSAVTIDPSGRFVYVANLGSDNVSAYTIDEKSGRLVPVAGSPFSAGTLPSAIAVDALGKFVYVTNESSNNVSGYTINSTTGALTPIAGSPFPAGNSPMSVAVDPNDRLVYVANEGSNDISGYLLQGNGALSALAGSPFAAGGGGVNSVTEDPNGQMLFVAGDGGVFVYTINQIVPFFGRPVDAGLRLAVWRRSTKLRDGGLHRHVSLCGE